MVEGLENCVGGVVGEILVVVDQRSARTRPRLRSRGEDGSRFRGGPAMVPYGGGGNDTDLQIRLVTKFHEFDHFFNQVGDETNIANQPTNQPTDRPTDPSTDRPTDRPID